MPLETGQILNNRYRIVKLLGQGGFGAVYRAWDLNLERPRALKENLEVSPEAQRQFKREAQILCDLEHPNLPRVVDHFVIPDQGQYLVMDFVEGEDLQEKLNMAGGPLLPEQALPWILQVCEALEYLHNQEPPVIHRDIKPANIRVTSGPFGSGQAAGRAKLVDFGIAKVYDPSQKTTLGARAVTPGYSPPEQYGLGATDVQSDVYALGATLYCLLTGREPPASVDIVSGSVEPPAPVHMVNPRVPAAISEAIDKAMQVNRSTRCTSVREFRLALTSNVIEPAPVLQRTGTIHISSPAEAVGPAIELPQHKKPVQRRFRWGYILIGALALVTVVGGVLGILRLLSHPSVEISTSVTSIPTMAPVSPKAPDTDTPILSPAFEPLVVDAHSCDYGGSFRIIRSVDESMLEFAFCQPEPAFLVKIANPTMSIYPFELLNSPIAAGQLTQKPVGSGAYQVAEWKQGEFLTLVPFPDYWEERASSELVILWEEDPQIRFSRLLQGDADAVDSPPPEQYPREDAGQELRWVIRPATDIFYLGMNNRFSPFNNESVRQALAMGIDRQWLVDNFMPEASEAATHFTPCIIPFGCNSEPWYEFNPDLGRKLLADAGYPDGFTTELALRDVERPYLPTPLPMAEGIVHQLKDNLNIQTEIVVMEQASFLDQIFSGERAGLFLLGWVGDYPHISNFLDTHFGENSGSKFGDLFPDIYGRLKEAFWSSMPDEQNKAYAEANHLIKEHVPMVPISHTGSAVVYHRDVENPQASPYAVERFRLMSREGQQVIRFMQSREPEALYCAALTDGDSMRACAQVAETLFRFSLNGAEVEPALAESCEPNEDKSVWRCYLRKGVNFHDGSTLDANDVVMSLAVQWDASSPLHVESSTNFSYWEALWGAFINQP